MDVFEPAPLENVSEPLLANRTTKPLESTAKPEILVDAHIGIKWAVLGHVPDPAPSFDRIPENILAANGRLAGSCRKESGQDAHGGGFPGPVWTEEPNYLTFIHLKRNISHCRVFTVIFGQVFDYDHGSIRVRGKRHGTR